MKKIIFIVIDGLGDRPIKQLGNKTPLKAAKTPNLDWLAENGICGLVKPWQIGEKPESDTAHLALFGYDPNIYYLGRGPYEAMGIGMNLKEGNIALRANFATVDEDLKVIDRRAGRISNTSALIKSLNGKTIEGVKFLLKKSIDHRAVLVLRGQRGPTSGFGPLSSAISDSDPKITRVRPVQIKPLDKSKQAKFTARILNKFLNKTHHILKNHPLNKKRIRQRLLPANCLLVRGAGKLKKTPSFYQKYKLKAACIAGGGLYKGIAKILGMNLINVRGVNALPSTNLRGKFLAAKRALKKYDFVFLHIKAADNLAEDGNFRGKKVFIEKIDKNLKPLLNLKNSLVVVTADHSTCCSLKRHCKEPIPILIYPPKFYKVKLGRVYGQGIKPNRVKEFSEKACKKGKLGKIKQLNLMEKVLRVAKK